MTTEWQNWMTPRCPNCGGGLWQYEACHTDGKHTWKQCVVCGAIMDHYVITTSSGTTITPPSQDPHYVSTP